jgi:hypothetical protein
MTPGVVEEILVTASTRGPSEHLYDYWIVATEKPTE